MIAMHLQGKENWLECISLIFVKKYSTNIKILVLFKIELHSFD